MIKTKKNCVLWKQINYRTTNNLLSAEFLHDLYNRHYPNVNSIRFRNTLLTKKGTDTYSYAPTDEWDNLAKWYGYRFLRGRGDTYTGLDELLNYDKPILKALIERFKTIKIDKIDDIDLALDLIDLHYISLGEIYRVNLVQIEHALNYAIIEELKKYYKSSEDQADALSTLVFSASPTIAKIEEEEFLDLVISNIDSSPQTINKSIQDHYKKYSYVHSAYGASNYVISDYIKKYAELAKLGKSRLIKKREDVIAIFEDTKRKRDKLLKKLQSDKILIKNISYMAKIGVLRDKNKALMGTTNEWRDRIIQEVIRRTKVSIDEISWYLLQEIAELIVNRKKLDSIEIIKRRQGVVFTRQEHLGYSYSETESLVKPQCDSTILIGTCASCGIAKGKVCIIKNSLDIKKMSKHDIMVSPGTDFDLINAMQIAGAIVTEEGGLLSHASVVSRELKLPCIIGVSGATNKLHDGDLIEVNASLGKITRITSNCHEK